MSEKYYMPDQYWLCGFVHIFMERMKKTLECKLKSKQDKQLYKFFSSCIDMNSIWTVLRAVFLLCTYQRSRIFPLETQMLNILLQYDPNSVVLQLIYCVLSINSSSMTYEESLFTESSTSKIYYLRGVGVNPKARTSTVGIVTAGHIYQYKEKLSIN